MKNVLVIPFHDWRKIIKEGFRTRDSHFIESLSAHKNKIRTVVINRPITLLEIVATKKKQKISGEILFSKKGFSFYKINEELYVIDYISKDILNHYKKKHSWYFDAYSNKEYVSFIKDCLELLNIKNQHILSQNIFAYKLVDALSGTKKIFDAWDNFIKFSSYKGIRDEIVNGYKEYARICDFWITNSKDNISDFKSKFNLEAIHLIKNGVDKNRFDRQTRDLPNDLKNIPTPIVGFGGKITHLIDVDLLNEVIAKTPNKSFVFVGQILDKNIFNRIKKTQNFYYLGDKHYDIYPNYVHNFDICIVPYIVSKEKQTGANTIKVYEYLATGKKVVGTRGNGLEDLNDFLYIADSSDEFSELLKVDGEQEKIQIDIDHYSWDSKLSKLLRILKE